MPPDERAGRLAAIARVDAAGVEVRAAFAEAGVDCLLLKGRSFAHRLYDAVWERPYSDTDVLIRAEALPEAERVLRGLGYQRVDRDADRLGAPGYAHTFARPDGALIDVHWNLSGVTASPGQAWSALNAHTASLVVGNRPARVLGDAGIALTAALHNAHHGWPVSSARPRRSPPGYRSLRRAQRWRRSSASIRGSASSTG